MSVGLTWETLLIKSDDFISFHSKFQDRATQVGICGRTFMYREIKAYTVKKFVEEKRLKFEDNRCNEIILHDIYKGGK